MSASSPVSPRPEQTRLQRVSGFGSRFWGRLRGRGSPLELGFSVALGLFIGCLPLYGLHLPLCLALCLPLGLDAVAAYLAAQISNPWFAPFLLALEARIGARLLGRPPLAFEDLRVERAGELFERTLAGSLVVGPLLAVAGGAMAFAIASRVREPRPEAAAVARTLERYRSAPRKDRFYVDLKLRTDPALQRLVSLGALGRVLDAGAGRGQFGLFLLENGQLDALSGFDPDPRKVALSAHAGGGDARYELASLERYDLPPRTLDTVLLIDVLHYLAPAEQDAALARIATWLAPGGRIVVRELDARSRLRSAVTRAAERIATAVGYNRATRALGFRPLGELVAALEALGFDCTVEDASSNTPFDNSLIVARLS